MEYPKSKAINVSKDTSLEEGCFRPGDKAKPNCKHCYGTGIVGTNVTRNTLIICRCVDKKLKEEEGQKNQK